MRYLARISYDGSKFEGFQRLPNGKGVQNELERVLSELSKTFVEVKGAGRTDAGVHALDQCVHFDLNTPIEEEKLKYVLNRLLCPYVFINLVEKVSSSFHARHDVKEKTYIYQIYTGEKNPFLEDYTYAFPYDLDIDKMKECSKLFLGLHDFRNFVSGEREDYRSVIDDITITKEEKFIRFTFKGKGFYRYMVRSLVGAIVDVGLNKASLEDIKNALDLKSSKTFRVVPSQGLYLVKVQY